MNDQWRILSGVKGERGKQPQQRDRVQWLVGAISDDRIKEARSALGGLLSCGWWWRWDSKDGICLEGLRYVKSLQLQEKKKYLCSTTKYGDCCILQTTHRGCLSTSKNQ